MLEGAPVSGRGRPRDSSVELTALLLTEAQLLPAVAFLNDVFWKNKR